MLEAELKIGVIDLLEELLAFALRLGAVIGKQGPPCTDLSELLLCHEAFSEVVEHGLFLFGEGCPGQAPEAVHEIQVVVHVRPWH